MSYRAIPGVVYTNPEIGGVGETEDSLQQKGLPFRVLKLPMAYSGRFVAENEGVNGICKMLLGPDNTILGAHESCCIVCRLCYFSLFQAFNCS